MITCTRCIEWDMGHRVLNHEGKCARLHGHRYKAEITCYANDLDEVGRVIDFGVIKAKLGEWIDDTWDHRTMICRDDTELLQVNLSLKGAHFVVSNNNPTAENIAQMLYYQAHQMLTAHGVTPVKVRVWETPNCYAECSPI